VVRCRLGKFLFGGGWILVWGCGDWLISKGLGAGGGEIKNKNKNKKCELFFFFLTTFDRDLADRKLRQ
jgi:hypothetical protein